MFEYFENEPLFGACALVGTALFVIQLGLNFLGALDEDEGTGYFKWISKQAVVGFLMMFGWVALTCKIEWEFGSPVAGVIGVFAGIITMLVVGSIFKAARKLKSTGTVFRIEEAVGKTGVVYTQIPKGGMGKITLSIQEMTYEIDAVSLGEELVSFTSVQVIKTIDDRTVGVVAIK